MEKIERSCSKEELLITESKGLHQTYFWDDKYKKNMSSMNSTRLNFNIINNAYVDNDSPSRQQDNLRKAHNISGYIDRLGSSNWNEDYRKIYYAKPDHNRVFFRKRAIY